MFAISKTLVHTELIAACPEINGFPLLSVWSPTGHLFLCDLSGDEEEKPVVVRSGTNLEGVILDVSFWDEMLLCLLAGEDGSEKPENGRMDDEKVGKMVSHLKIDHESLKVSVVRVITLPYMSSGIVINTRGNMFYSLINSNKYLGKYSLTKVCYILRYSRNHFHCFNFSKFNEDTATLKSKIPTSHELSLTKIIRHENHLLTLGIDGAVNIIPESNTKDVKEISFFNPIGGGISGLAISKDRDRYVAVDKCGSLSGFQRRSLSSLDLLEARREPSREDNKVPQFVNSR